METIVITGVCSAMGRLLAEKLAQTRNVIGIDKKTWKGAAPKTNFTFHKTDIRKRGFTNLFYKHRKSINSVIHLAVSKNYTLTPEKLHEQNIIAARSVLNRVMEYQVKKFVLLSEHSVYGALPGNIMRLKENSPLNGGRIFKENTSIVEVDLMCTELFWAAPEIETVILRPVNILGPKTRGLLNTYLKLKAAPSVMGFNPMMQVIHEDDVVSAVEIALQPGVKGIYNVTGPGSLPLPVLADEAGLKRIPLPAPLAKNTIRFVAPAIYKLGRRLFGMESFPFPVSGLSYFQYMLNIDGTSFRTATGFEPEKSLAETVESIK